MNKTWKIIVGVALVVLAGAAVYFGSGSLFQGRLATGGPGSGSGPMSWQINPMTRYQNLYTIKLNPNSPSGQLPIGSHQKVAVFDLCANSKNQMNIDVSGLNVGFRGYLLDMHNLVSVFGSYTADLGTLGTSTQARDINMGGIEFEPDKHVILEPGTCDSLEVYADTASLMSDIQALQVTTYTNGIETNTPSVGTRSSLPFEANTLDNY